MPIILSMRTYVNHNTLRVQTLHIYYIFRFLVWTFFKPGVTIQIEMKFIDFLKAVAKGPPAPVYIIGGREVFFRRESLSRIRKKVFGDGDPGTAFMEFSGDRVEARDVLDELRTRPLGAAHKLVLVENADKFVLSNIERLVKYAANPADTATLVLEMLDNPASSKKKFGPILGHAVLVETDMLEDKRLANWLVWRAQDSYGMKLPQMLASRLISVTGSELQRLDAALGKLAPVCAGRTQTAADVDSIAAGGSGQNVFALTEAVGNRDTTKALSVLDDIFSDGLLGRNRPREHNVDSIVWQLFAMIQREMKLLWQAKRLAARKMQPGAIAAAMNMKQWIVGRILNRAERYSEPELDAAFDALLEAELALKRSSQPRRLVFEMLVCRITLGQKAKKYQVPSTR
ncbi:MAG: DNA polymerase III subunit delta [Planctomycetota bacterium]|nr:MAG: DNA polymerase III subunit delta [Planctomycetota bacterium]